MKAEFAVAVLGLFTSQAVLASSVLCPDPPPPAASSKIECEYVLEMSFPSCPEPNLMPGPGPSPANPPSPDDDHARSPLERSKHGSFAKTQYYTQFVCANEPFTPQLECHYLGNDLGQCSAWPAEKVYSGFLSYETTLTRNGGVEYHTDQTMQFYCPFGEHVSGALTVHNGTATSHATSEFDCLPPPPPSPVDAMTVGCAAGLPGYNQLDITEPHGYVDYFVVELKRVNYAGSWQIVYQGPSRRPIIRPQADSYVRVKACNAGGCSPYYQSPHHANPSMYCP